MSFLTKGLEEKYDRTYSDREIIVRYSKFIVKHKKHLFSTIFFIIIATALTLIIPFTLQIAVDDLENGITENLILLSMIFLGLSILLWIAEYILTYENTKFTSRTTQDIRMQLFSDIQHHDISFFDKNKTGKLMSRIMDDTQALADFVAQTSNIVVNVLIAIGTIVILFFIDPYLTLLTLTIIPFLILLILVFRKIARSLSREWRSSISSLNDSFQENIAGIKVSKSFGRIESTRLEFEKLNQENYKVSVKRSMFFSSIFPFVFALSNVGLYLVLYAGGLSSIRTGNPSMGTLVLFVAYLNRFYFPIMLITTYYQQLQAGLAAAERIFSLMDIESKVKNTGTNKSNIERGEIEFKNVSFSYDDNTPVYRDFNLQINPGETIALVGHTGSGKSTLVSLLLRFYEIQYGEILIDKQDLKSYDLHHFRSHLGMVLQDPLLFSGTIEDNIRYGNPNASENEVEQAARAANVWEFIKDQTLGLREEVRERGGKLSQGQRQLISIARAFLVNPRILLLDEATASIDAYSEALIQEAIDRLLHDRTSIIIAHRLTTVKRADRIIVLEKGEIIEQGNHSNLIVKGGKYAELYNTYFAFQEIKD
ncbi:MAG: ABC transporter ATP-binding protein/permease [Candidatus Heimdallarchaeota archaeon]|nr:ABC transporter ATP-binding protein/permease [Candidatus Heimdallarchaeota archaeon]